MERLIEKLPALQKEMARRKIVPISGNYEDTSFKERLDLKSDIALLACLPTLSKVLPAVVALCPSKTCIAYFPSSREDPGSELAFRINTIAQPHGLYFQFADEQQYWSDASVAAFRTL